MDLVQSKFIPQIQIQIQIQNLFSICCIPNVTVSTLCSFVQGVRLAEQNYLAEAIECFTRAIELDPQQPSPFNNRAQAYQLQNKTKGKFRGKNSRDMSHKVS